MIEYNPMFSFYFSSRYLITIVSRLRFFSDNVSFILINDSLSDWIHKYSARLPTVVRSRECFCPLQAENWPAQRKTRERRTRLPFLLFGGPRAHRAPLS